MTATAKPPVTAADMVARLRRHYLPPQPLPGGMFAAEVGLNGQSAVRRCDAIYIGFTSASGRGMVGHEIKVSRGDWLAELNQPHKADFWSDACHSFYVVAPSVDVVRPTEVPHGWGLMVINPRTTTRLDIAVRADRKPDHSPPWLAVRSVMSSWDYQRRTDESRARETVRDDVRRELEQEQSKRAARRGLDGEAGRIQRIIAEVHRLQRQTAGGYAMAPTDEMVIAALLEASAVRSAAQNINWHLDGMLTALHDPLTRVAEEYETVKKARALAQALVDTPVRPDPPVDTPTQEELTDGHTTPPSTDDPTLL
jgi:hypothetical protein